MSYYLFLIQDYDEITLTSLETAKLIDESVIKLLEKDFGRFISKSSEKPKADKYINLKEYVTKRKKELETYLNEVIDEWKRTRNLTQDILNQEYDNQIEANENLRKSVGNSNATIAIYHPIRKSVGNVKREATRVKKEMERHLSIFTEILT